MSDNLSHLLSRCENQRTLFEDMVTRPQSDEPSRPQDRSRRPWPLIGPAVVFGTTSFYDLLKPGGGDHKVYVCNGSACCMAGGQDQLRQELQKHFHHDQIGHMTCLGRCHENGAFHFNGSNYSARSADQIEAIVHGQAEGHTDSYAVASDLRTPILTADPIDASESGAWLAGILKRTPQQIFDEVETSALRGRGGAGFPLAFKLDVCRRAAGDRKYVICNADEGDPGAYSDRYLLEQQPLRVLLGMILAGYVIGADTGILYIRAEYPQSVTAIEQAIEALRRQGACGGPLPGSEFHFDFKIIRGAGAYICGEETSLISSIEGQRPEVRVRPPYPVRTGLFNRPTLVSNVETLANLPFIADHGGQAYAGYGTDRSTGTKLVSLDSFFNRPGIYEVAMGQKLSTVIHELGGGFKLPVKALHIGGPLGGLVPAERFDTLTVDFESFEENGFLLGHAGVVSIPQHYPMIKYLHHLFDFVAAESCGKCFPCRLGSVRGGELLHRAMQQGERIDRALFDDLLETLELGSLCALGGGIPLPVKNALTYFMDELEAYFGEVDHV